MKDNNEELVHEEGNVTGAATGGECRQRQQAATPCSPPACI